MKKIIATVLFSLFFLKSAVAQDVTLSNETKLPINISSDMAIFTDSTAQLSLEQIKAQRFIQNLKNHFVFPFSNNVYWIKFQFKNTDAQNKEWVIKWNNAMVERLDFYVSDSLQKNYQSTVQKLYTTQKLKKIYEEEPHFSFQLTPHSSKTLFIRLDARRGHYGSVELHSAQSFTDFRYDNFASQGIANGLVIFRLFLLLTLSLFIIKEPLFRAYSFQIVLKTAAFWGLQNVLGPIFTNNPAWAVVINFWGTNSPIVGACVFVLWAFTLKKLPKWAIIGLYFFITVAVIINILVAMDYQWYWLKTGALNMVFGIFFILCIYVHAIFKKISFNIYYSIPFLLGITSYFLVNVRLLTGIEYRPIGTIIGLFFLGEIFLFVLFLGQIFRKTELNKLMAERKLNFNIEQNNRLKEIDNLKTTFFTNISHELRTPLTLITAPIQELLVKYPSDNLVPLMNRNAQRLLVLINQLLDISKLEAGQMNVEISQNDVSTYLKTLVSSFTSLAESKKVTFQFTHNQGEVLGYIDQDKTEKIITNLLSNAFKFTSEGGKVNVESQFSDDFKNLIITVSDSGIGISKEKQSKIFDRFYQIDSTPNRHFEGTGIGLALVKELVGVLKGEINVMSQEGQGTTFVLTLPIDFETWKEEISNKNVFSPVVGVSTDYLVEYPNNQSFTSVVDVLTELRVEIPNYQQNILLIVDDNADIRSYIRSVFEDKYHIIEAINGKEGILKAQEKTPNLIISDLMMPEMDGFEFCKYLKSNETTSHIPVIMLTAKANIESRIEGLALGADDYLIKPFNANEIQVRVKNLLDKQENLRQYFTGKFGEIKQETPKNVVMEDIFLKKAKNILEKHLSESGFNVEQFCQEINMSSSQLLRKLKALTNQTTVEFVREYRLQRAAEMLEQKTNTVSDVAFAVGFESLSYFTKSFQEKFGVLPSEYKEKQVA